MTVKLCVEGADDDARAFWRLVMHRLEELNVTDPDFFGELTTGRVSIQITTDVEPLSDGVCFAATAVRTALHAAGASTPDWPQCSELEPEEDGDGRWIVRLVGSSQDLVSA